MEDKGFIDKSLKGIIKDKIISGDKALEAALDNFEKGNTADLEGKWCGYAPFVGKVSHRLAV
jgi:hypothetical protein